MSQDDYTHKNKPEPKYIIDPKDVEKKDDSRARRWAAEVMQKHESKLSDKFKDRQIIWRGDVDPEDVDVRNVYPFPELHWIIYRNGALFDIMLCSKNKILFVSSFAKI